jgi:hypothetical protein
MLFSASFGNCREFLFDDGYVLRRLEGPGGVAQYRGFEVDWFEYVGALDDRGEVVDWLEVDPDNPEYTHVTQVREQLQSRAQAQ